MMGDALHCYFRLGGKQFRRSTKTSDLREAKLLALTWHKNALLKMANGEEVDSVSFAKLKREYLKHIQTLPKHAYHSATIERHMLPYFARFDDVAKIKRADMVQYVAFRRGQGDQAPMPQTINRENSVLRQMLRYASDRGWLKVIPRIENESDRLTKRRRRHFTADEYRKLHRAARKRASEFDGQELLTRQGWHRKLLYDVILLLSNTGMRVDESKSIIWRNIDWDDGSILLEHAGKTRSSRRVIARATAMIALRRIQERRLKYLSRFEDQALDDNEKVISLPDGTHVVSLKKGFERLLDACEFTYLKKEDRHALTSLRHTYATFRLTTRSGKRATMRGLAKQMGTSERMITQHYGHDDISDYRDELAG